MSKILEPVACGKCSACLTHDKDPWRCRKPGNVDGRLGPLDTYYDPATGQKKDLGPKLITKSAGPAFMNAYMPTLSIGYAQSEKKFSKDLPFVGSSNDATIEKCAHSHPALPLTDGLVVYGGAAASPVPQDCDIYVSLDSYTCYMKSCYPWNGTQQFISFPIHDMDVPSAPGEFKKFIAWLVAQIRAGKKVHIGCMGGHGRTGMVLAAIVKELMGDADAIDYVRKHYCHKAVETRKQGLFLQEHFGITPKSGHKDFHVEKKLGKSPAKGSYTSEFNEKYASSGTIQIPVEPMPAKDNIWGL